MSSPPKNSIAKGTGSLDAVAAYWDAAVAEVARCPAWAEDARRLAELAEACGGTDGELW